MKAFSLNVVRVLLALPVVLIEGVWYFKFLTYSPTKDLIIASVIFHLAFLPILVLLYQCAKYLKGPHYVGRD